MFNMKRFWNLKRLFVCAKLSKQIFLPGSTQLSICLPVCLPKEMFYVVYRNKDGVTRNCGHLPLFDLSSEKSSLCDVVPTMTSTIDAVRHTDVPSSAILLWKALIASAVGSTENVTRD
eukprot:IDg9872t1